MSHQIYSPSTGDACWLKMNKVTFFSYFQGKKCKDFKEGKEKESMCGQVSGVTEVRRSSPYCFIKFTICCVALFLQPCMCLFDDLISCWLHFILLQIHNLVDFIWAVSLTKNRMVFIFSHFSYEGGKKVVCFRSTYDFCVCSYFICSKD